MCKDQCSAFFGYLQLATDAKQPWHWSLLVWFLRTRSQQDCDLNEEANIDRQNNTGGTEFHTCGFSSTDQCQWRVWFLWHAWRSPFEAVEKRRVYERRLIAINAHSSSSTLMTTLGHTTAFRGVLDTNLKRLHHPTPSSKWKLELDYLRV